MVSVGTKEGSRGRSRREITDGFGIGFVYITDGEGKSEKN